MKVQEVAKELGKLCAQGMGEFDLNVFQWVDQEGRQKVSSIIPVENCASVDLYSSTASFNPSWVHANTGKGYECSTQGDKRFSAMVAAMPDGRTIEMWYQCDIKGYDIGGTNWRLGKGKPALIEWTPNQLWEHYLHLWEMWAIHNLPLMAKLSDLATEHGNVLTDQFATTRINQAAALADIINRWFR